MWKVSFVYTAWPSGPARYWMKRHASSGASESGIRAADQPPAHVAGLGPPPGGGGVGAAGGWSGLRVSAPGAPSHWLVTRPPPRSPLRPPRPPGAGGAPPTWAGG